MGFFVLDDVFLLNKPVVTVGYLGKKDFEPQRHKGTKFFWLCLRYAQQKGGAFPLWLCGFVVPTKTSELM